MTSLHSIHELFAGHRPAASISHSNRSQSRVTERKMQGGSIRIIERKIHFTLDDADRAAPELITTALLLLRTLDYCFTTALQACGLNLALELVHFSLNNADGAAPEFGILDRAAEVLLHDLLGGVITEVLLTQSLTKEPD
jgi:hypothetical protein